MFQTKKTKWRTLENTAKIFPATSGKRDERVFRFACEMKENIREDLLQEALDQTLEQFPMFLCVLRKGLFWNYLEESELRPKVRQEYRLPCSGIYVRDQKNLLFEVTYYKTRINFETYHALTDGTGALNFLKMLVYQYLMLAHPGEVKEPVSNLGIKASTEEDMTEDGFSKYYGSGEKIDDIPKYKAHQFPYRKKEHGRLKLIEGVVPTFELLQAARERKTTVTVLLTAVYLCAIARDMSVRQKKKPVSLMIPVNLRSFFPSESMRNFFGWIDVGYDFGTQSGELEDVIQYVSEFFQRELTPDRIGARMDNLVKFEKNPFVRILPLELKLIIMQLGAKFSTGEDTAVFSNIGRIQMPQECEPYLDYFEFYTTTPSMELCMCSYEDNLTLSFTSAYVTNRVEENFFGLLREMGVKARMISGGDPAVEREHFPDCSRTNSSHDFWYRLFTFICLAAVVVSGILDFLLTPGIYWAMYVAGGAVSAWVLTTVGYRKRRNPLKNVVWQMVLIGIGLILWDYATGFGGWSLDIGLPCTVLCGIAAVTVLTICLGMNSDQYMIYLLIACAAGFVPGILLLAGVIKLKVLAVICAGVSFLGLAALALFQWPAFKNELAKKFHM